MKTAHQHAARLQAEGDPRRLGEILVEEGHIQPHEVLNALNVQTETRGSALAETTIRVESPGSQRAEIVLQARAAIGQRMTILLNDVAIGEHEFTTAEFAEVRASGALQPGQNRLTFRYSMNTASKDDARPRGVLFRAMDLYRH